MKALKNFAIVACTLLATATFTGCEVYTSTVATSPYENPIWAPPYYAGVRYYYLPDIEAYYDLSTHEFIFLNNGQWIFAHDLTGMYSNFDLNDCFTVALNINVYQPWMHHHYYLSHYPRYYYRNYYDHNNIPYVRGFNENTRKAIYWSENEHNKARNWDSDGLKVNRHFVYTREDRQQQTNRNNRYNNQNKNDNNNQNWNRNSRNDNQQTQNKDQQYKNTDNRKTDNNSQENRPNIFKRQGQSTNYYGRKIGQPVKVEKQMRQESPKSKEHSERQGRK